jgi:hypothetical protein
MSDPPFEDPPVEDPSVEDHEARHEARHAGAEPEAPAALPAPDPASAPTPEARPPAQIDWRGIKAYFSLFDFGTTPDTKVGWAIRLAAIFVLGVLLWRRVQIATLPMLTAKPPLPIPTEEIEDYRFRLPEHTRREIFTQLATAELAERDRAIKANTWAGHLWSREDDRGHYERVAVRATAAKYHVSLSQTYLVLDEGIRKHWPAPDGNPLPATTPPLSIRQTW